MRKKNSWLRLAALLVLVLASTGCPTRETPPERATMTFTFIDGCDDGVSPIINIYDTTQNVTDPENVYYWGDYYLQYFEAPLSLDVHCIKGNYICYGAWMADGSGYWGCGQNCTEACDHCCSTCDNTTLPAVRFTCEPGYGLAPAPEKVNRQINLPLSPASGLSPHNGEQRDS